MRALFLAFIVASCSGSPSQQQHVTAVAAPELEDLSGFRIKTAADYESTKQKCLAARDELRDKYQAAENDSLRKIILAETGKLFTNHLVSDIIPWWYGTPWDFNGYTAKPGEGEVACGYFVSTTLLHSGFNLNRYSLAQQGPRDEAITLNLSDNLITLQDSDPEQVKTFFTTKKVKNGIYFVGLDFHVGYLLKEGDKLFFIHSNYIGSEGVTIEPIGTSEAFRASRNFYIARISSNGALMKKWILQEPVKIYRGN